ncbi:MAG: FAD-dependent oxidoreductase [Xenococcaceae cyanobacterium MO_207.B15]|nr:FAD-dependent oxidoreductase [Xenococcaceae cyanobacterium MO_207.B15]
MEYDLVVIGSSKTGIEAASKATILGARVALVTQTQEEFISNNPNSNYFRLREATNLVTRLNYNAWIIQKQLNCELAVDFKAISELDSNNLGEINSLSQLAAFGADIILGEGEFCRLPKQALIVGNRQLRSRTFLIATDSNFTIPLIPGIEQVNCLTYNDVWQQKDLTSLGNNLAIVGSYASSLELAQVLRRLGKKVTLVVERERILPQEELAAVMIIQAQLEADGIEIITNSPVTQIKKIAGESWLQAGDKALVIDTVIFTEEKEFKIAGLNLAGVGVKYDDTGITVNSLLQTTNKSIYACGDSIGIFSSLMKREQINIALKNILLLPWYKIDYSLIPRVVFTQPTLVSIGMIETEARQNYGNKIYVVREYFKNVIQSPILGKTTGWCQFILTSQGEILGCTIIGDRAEELISTIMVMIQNKIKFSNNPIQALLKTEISTICPSFSAILNKVATEFHKQKLQRRKHKYRWLQTWLKIKRNFSK